MRAYILQSATGFKNAIFFLPHLVYFYTHRIILNWIEGIRQFAMQVSSNNILTDRRRPLHLSS